MLMFLMPKLRQLPFPSVPRAALTVLAFSIQSDETFRIDWKPGMTYMKGGVIVTIPDEFFPCGGNVLRGRFDFPKNGSGTSAPGRHDTAKNRYFMLQHATRTPKNRRTCWFTFPEFSRAWSWICSSIAWWQWRCIYYVGDKTSKD